MGERAVEEDALAARVEEIRQRILALPPTEFCGHFSHDFNGNCMTCAREAERREDMAKAWDEGWNQGTGDAWQNGGHESKPNPYRPIPSDVPTPSDGGES